MKVSLKNRKNIGLLKCVAIVLSVLMVMTVIPFSTVSAEVVSQTPIESAAEDSAEILAEEPYIVDEIIEKREIDTKHFLMSDGSYMAAKYNIPVHYYDENNTLQDADFSFTENSDEEIESRENGYKIKFAKKSKSNKLVSISKENYKMDWALNEADKVSAEYTAYSSAETTDISVLKNISGTVEYNDIMPSVDVVYEADVFGVKENIVMKTADAPSRYTFIYKTHGMSFRVSSSGDIELYDPALPEKIIFTIEKPYMYDANKYYSEDVEMLISDTNNGFEVTLVPNAEWLANEERVYPVVIDPSTLSSTVRSDIWDIDMMKNQSVMFSCNAEDLVVGVDNTGRIFRSVIKFLKLPTISSTERIMKATLNVTAYQGPLSNADVDLRVRPTGNPKVNIHRVTQYWPETTDWNTTADDYDSIISDYFTYNTTDTNFTTDITKIVSGWYSGEYPNYGIMLKSADETTANRAMQFTSSDWGTSPTHETYRPVLVINYRHTLGLEDYWNYSTQDFGEFGGGYVNNYSGNLVYIHNDTSYNSGINGFTLSHVYNSGNSATSGHFGKGWGLNLVQTLKSVSIEGNSNVKYEYTDGDGTRHYFVLNSDGKIVDEDGLGLTYTDNSASDATLKHKITDKDKNVYLFDNKGFLRKITDPNGNYISLNFTALSTTDALLSSVTTSSGGNITLGYNSQNFLTSVTDNASRVTAFLIENSELKKITYPDGRVVTFTYSNGNLTSVTAPDNSKLEYSYENSRVKTAKALGKNGTAGNTLTFSYAYNQTKITDSKGDTVT